MVKYSALGSLPVLVKYFGLGTQLIEDSVQKNKRVDNSAQRQQIARDSAFQTMLCWAKQEEKYFELRAGGQIQENFPYLWFQYLLAGLMALFDLTWLEFHELFSRVSVVHFYF